MVGKIMTASFFLLLFCAHSLLAVNGDPGCEQVKQNLQNCLEGMESYQNETLNAFKQIFHEEHMCSPCTGLEKRAKEERAKRVRLEAEMEAQRARLEAENLAQRVQLEAKYDKAIAAYEPRIYLATDTKGVLRFSLATSEVKTVVAAGQDGIVGGVAYDWLRAKIYWCTKEKVFRANEKGSGRETALDTNRYGNFRALAFDWISGNVFVTTQNGFILACDGRSTMPFPCAAVFTGKGQILGIALNPTEGTMYWTSYTEGLIKKAGMDGSNLVSVASTSSGPVGIAIDFGSRCLYWATQVANKIESGDLDGTKKWWSSGAQSVLQRPDGARPWGIAVHGGRIYWSTAGSNKLESSTKTGSDIRLHHTEDDDINRIAVVPNFNLPTGRRNHCDGHSCSNVCVLTATSYKCIQ